LHIWNLKPKIQIKLNMTLLKLINNESLFIHGMCMKVNCPTLYCLIKNKFLFTFYPNAFEPLFIPNLNHLNHNCKVFITLHLGLHIERNGPHTPLIMPISSRMWLTLIWQVQISKPLVCFACLLILAIAFCSLRQN
jgi:hypothetical protein